MRTPNNIKTFKGKEGNKYEIKKISKNLVK